MTSVVFVVENRVTNGQIVRSFILPITTEFPAVVMEVMDHSTPWDTMHLTNVSNPLCRLTRCNPNLT